jgi:thiamine transport system permease protein
VNRGAGRAWPLLLAAAVPLAVLVVFFRLPVGGMVHRGFWPDGRFAPGDVLDVLTRSRTGKVVWFTAWSAAAATAVALVLGVPTAFVLHRLRFPGRGLVRALVMVPFVLPTVVVGVAFTELMRTGPLAPLGLEGSATAIVAALAFFNVSVVVRTVGASWQALDPRREEAAAALGASPRQVFRTVTAPALAPAVASAASVVFLFCATGFGVVLTMGGLRYSNVETEIYLLTTQELDLPAAAALSLLQRVMIVLLLSGVGRVRRPVVRRTSYAGRRPRARDWPLLLTAVVALAYLLFPIGTLLTASLRAGDGWSLANYRALSGTGSHQALLVPVTDALTTSLANAVQAAAIAVLLGLLVAYVVSRRPTGRGARRLVGAFDGLFMLPLGVSAVTLGFGFLITLDRPPLDLRSSSVLIPIAQAMVALPLVVRTVAPVWSTLDDRQRQAAASLGAGPLRVFATVDLPAAWRPLLAATGFAFAMSLGEFGATSFLARSDHPTLPVVIYKLLGHPGVMNFGMAMAGSVVLAAATTVVMLAVERLRVPSIGAF